MMSKIAIVGVEGSGKTVLMTVLGEKYQTPDQYGLFLSPETRETSDFHRVNLGKLENGDWPIETPHDSVRSLRWTLQRKDKNDDCVVMADLNFLDFAGEIYREAFDGAADGTGGQWVDECETLRRHVKESDVLIVLVNLRNVVLKMTDERTNQVVWLSKGIVDYAKRELKIPHVALAFTQVDAYREVIEDQGGDLKAVLQKYLPDVSNVYSNLPLFALSAVDKTERGDDGLLRPAPGFGSKGLEELVHWILGCTEEGKKYAAEIASIKARPRYLWNEIVSGMNALREDAVQAIGLSAAERFAKVSALQSAAVELSANDLRHTVPDFTEEKLIEWMTELESWAKFAGLANEYVKAVEAKRNDIATQIEGRLSAEGVAMPYLLSRAREEVGQIISNWKNEIKVRMVLLVLFSIIGSLLGYNSFHKFFSFNIWGSLFVQVACLVACIYSLVRVTFLWCRFRIRCFLCTVFLVGAAIGGTLCGAQALFLDGEIVQPTVATRAYSSGDRVYYRNLNFKCMGGYFLFAMMMFMCVTHMSDGCGRYGGQCKRRLRIQHHKEV